MITGITRNDGSNQYGRIVVDGTVAGKVEFNGTNMSRRDDGAIIRTYQGQRRDDVGDKKCVRLDLGDDRMIVFGVAREVTSRANGVDVLGLEYGAKTLVGRRSMSSETWEQA